MSVHFKDTPMTHGYFAMNESLDDYASVDPRETNSIDDGLVSALGLGDSETLTSFHSVECNYATDAKNRELIGRTPHHVVIQRNHNNNALKRMTTKVDAAPIPPTPVVESIMWSDSMSSFPNSQMDDTMSNTTMDMLPNKSRFSNTPVANSLKLRSQAVERSQAYSGPTSSFLVGSGTAHSAPRPVFPPSTAKRDSDVESVDSNPSSVFSSPDNQSEVENVMNSLANTPIDLRCDSTPIACRSQQSIGRPGHTPAAHGFHLKNANFNKNMMIFHDESTSRLTVPKESKIPLASSKEVNMSKSVAFEGNSNKKTSRQNKVVSHSVIEKENQSTSFYTSMTMTPSLSQSAAHMIAHNHSAPEPNTSVVLLPSVTVFPASSKLSVSSSSDRSGLSLSHLAVEHPSPEREDIVPTQFQKSQQSAPLTTSLASKSYDLSMNVTAGPNLSKEHIPSNNHTAKQVVASSSFSLDFAAHQDQQPLLPGPPAPVTETKPRVSAEVTAAQTSTAGRVVLPVQAHFVMPAQGSVTASSAVNQYVSLGKGPVRNGLRPPKCLINEQPTVVVPPPAPVVVETTSVPVPSAVETKEETSETVAWEPIPNTLHLPKDWYTARKTRKDVDTVNRVCVSDIQSKLLIAENEATRARTTATAVVVPAVQSVASTAAVAPAVVLASPATSLSRYLSISPTSTVSPLTACERTVDSSMVSASVNAVAAPVFSENIHDASCQVDSAALNAALPPRPSVVKKEMVECAVQSSFDGTPLKLFQQQETDIVHPKAIEAIAPLPSLVANIAQPPVANLVHTDTGNEGSSYCLADFQLPHQPLQLVASYMTTPTRSPPATEGRAVGSVLADLSPLSIDGGRKVHSVMTHKDVTSYPSAVSIMQPSEKKKTRKNISFDTDVCFVPEPVEYTVPMSAKSRQLTQKARALMLQSPLGVAERVSASNKPKTYRRGTPWRGASKDKDADQSLGWDYLCDYESERDVNEEIQRYDYDEDSDQIFDQGRGDITILTDVAVANLTEGDLDNFTVDSTWTGRQWNSANVDDEQSACNTTFTVDSPGAFVSSPLKSSPGCDNQMPTLAIRSLKREQDSPLSVKEIDFCTAPGEFTTVMLSLQNHRQKPFELVSDCVFLRVEPLYKARQSGSQDAMQCPEDSASIFSVHPPQLTVAPRQQATLFITFAPGSICEGIFSGVMRIRCGKKSYTLLLRGESNCEYSVSSPTSQRAISPQALPVNAMAPMSSTPTVARQSPMVVSTTPVVASTPVALPGQRMMLQTPATIFQQKLKILQDKIADIGKRVLWTEDQIDDAIISHGVTPLEPVAAAEAPVTTAQEVDAFPMIVSFSPLETTGNNTGAMSQILTLSNQSPRPRIVRLSSPLPELTFSTTLATLMPNAQYKVVVRLDKLSAQSLTGIELPPRISKHSLYPLTEIVYQFDGIVKSVPVNVSGALLKPFALMPSPAPAPQPVAIESTVSALRPTESMPNQSAAAAAAAAAPVAALQHAVTATRPAEAVNSSPMMVPPAGKERESLYFRKSVALFGHVSLGNLVRTKVELCNASSKEVRIFLSDSLPSPFVLLHNDVIMRPKSFVRLPVRFVPTVPGEFHAELVAQTEDGKHIATIALTGSAYI